MKCKEGRDGGRRPRVKMIDEDLIGIRRGGGISVYAYYSENYKLQT